MAGEHSGVDVALAPNSSVILEPADSLAFHLQPQTAPQAVLTIRNVADDRQIAFKVKTTRPLRYLVRPNQGLLGPNGSASIMVILQQKDCDELLRLDPAERQLSNDKFLVQSIYVDDSFYELVKTKSTKEMADELTNMWARTDKRALSNKKLRCRFVQQDSDDAPRPATPPSPPRVSSNVSSAANATGDSRYQSRNSDDGRDEEMATPAQLSSALLQDDKPVAAKAVETRDSHAAGGKDSIQEVAALRKKYDEVRGRHEPGTCVMVMLVVTKQGVCGVDLDKTRQLLQKASTDAQRVKKMSEETSTLRHRKNGGVAGGSGSDDSQAITGKGGKDPGVRCCH
ncbi:hypothetical protein BBJ28_00006814 [Nothophytophthora sp. Chile5]|nr:hypothetical protein BBJ28_00006814 [Nothophytophthora sp. Chile5]